MTKHTVLNATHRALGAKMVDFGGWDMPISYGSQIEEHHAVRRDAGMFDVSHMTVVDLHGARCREFLRHLLANSVDKLKASGKALYSCMLNEQGGVIDDLIVYFLAEDFFRVVVNASTRDKDLAWIEKQAAAFDVKVSERPDFAMIAVQGPHAARTRQGKVAPAAAHRKQHRGAADQVRESNAADAEEQVAAQLVDADSDRRARGQPGADAEEDQQERKPHEQQGAAAREPEFRTQQRERRLRDAQCLFDRVAGGIEIAIDAADPFIPLLRVHVSGAMRGTG